MPATHNSTTDSLVHHSPRVTECSVCQETTIYEQLCAGARMFDLRYGNSDFASLKCPIIEFMEKKGITKERTHLYNHPYKATDIVSRHSIAKGSYFFEYLDQIRKF